jgi:hypothetical protein
MSAGATGEGAKYGAAAFLETWIRWTTFCDRYETEHCELAAQIVRSVAERNRR